MARSMPVWEADQTCYTQHRPEGSSYKLSVQIFPFTLMPTHTPTTSLTPCLQKLYIGTVVWDEWYRSRPLFNRQKRRQRKSCCLPGGEAANGTNRYQKKIWDTGLFLQYSNTDFRVSVHQIKEKSRQSTTQGLPGGHDSACKRATF